MHPLLSFWLAIAAFSFLMIGLTGGGITGGLVAAFIVPTVTTGVLYLMAKCEDPGDWIDKFIHDNTER